MPIIYVGKLLIVLDGRRIKSRLWNRTRRRDLIDDVDDEHRDRLSDNDSFKIDEWILSKLNRRWWFDKDVINIGEIIGICDGDSVWNYQM